MQERVVIDGYVAGPPDREPTPRRDGVHLASEVECQLLVWDRHSERRHPRLINSPCQFYRVIIGAVQPRSRTDFSAMYPPSTEHLRRTVRIPQVGETFGPYRVERLLGRGGMGAVFVANQIALSRPVALKVLLPQLADSEDYRRRFGREASALASAQSPHIVPIFDYGEIDGALFIATQLVPGGDLGARLKSTPMDQAVALEIAGDVATALADAHAVGVLHRDVKPSNVLVWDRQEGPHAYLCDFGIAKIEGTEHTSTDGIVGTWAFLSPERCNGAPASETSDIYSAGCVLWNMLTGTTPYAGTSVEMAMAHVVKPVPQLSGDTSGSPDQSDPEPLDGQGSQRSLSVGRRDGARDQPGQGHRSRDRKHSREASSGRWRARRSAATRRANTGRLDSAPAIDPERTYAEPVRHRLRNLLSRRDRGRSRSGPWRPGWRVAQGWVSTDRDPGTGARRQRRARRTARASRIATATCWNGEPAAALADCSNPEGVEGLAWAFPSFDVDDPSCAQSEATVVTKDVVFSYERTSGATWSSIATAHGTTCRRRGSHYSRVYDDPPVRVRSPGSATRSTWRAGEKNIKGFSGSPRRTSSGHSRSPSTLNPWSPASGRSDR